MGDNGVRVVTLSPPTSEIGVWFLDQSQVGKLVVVCSWLSVYSTYSWSSPCTAVTAPTKTKQTSNNHPRFEPTPQRSEALTFKCLLQASQAASAVPFKIAALAVKFKAE